MKINNALGRLRHTWRGERGDGAIGSIISMSAFIVLLVMFVWMILTYYSFRVLSTAANEGAAIGARYDAGLDGPDRQRGVTYAQDLIEATGSSSMVEGVAVEQGPLDEKRVEIIVSGRSVTPFFSLNLRATGSAPIEEFRPQGGEI